MGGAFLQGSIGGPSRARLPGIARTGTAVREGSTRTRELRGLPLQPENLIQCSPSVTFRRKFRLKVFSDETPVPPSLRFESTFQLEESDVGQFC